MQANYLTKAMYEESLRNEAHQVIRKELLEIDEEIMAAVDLKALQPSQVPPAGFYVSQCWSRVYEYPWAIERLYGGTESIAGMRILDVGPGLSPLPVYLARHGADVTCIDTHPVGISMLPARIKTSDLVGLPGVEELKMDIRDWKGEEEFDAITCVSVLEHVPDVDMVGLFKRWMYGKEGPKQLGKILVTLDIPLARVPYGVPFTAFADLLVWLCQEYGVTGCPGRGTYIKCPRYPGHGKMLNSSDFGEQGEIVGKEIGVFYLELGG